MAPMGDPGGSPHIIYTHLEAEEVVVVGGGEVWLLWVIKVGPYHIHAP